MMSYDSRICSMRPDREKGRKERNALTPSRCDSTPDEKLILPRSNSTSYVTNAETPNSRKHVPQPRTTDPHPHPQRLFFPLVEHAKNDHCTRIDTSLKDAQERARSCKTGKVVRCGMAHEHDTPDDDCSGHEFGDWEALEEETGGVFPEEVTQIKEGSEPGVLGADEVRVFTKVEDSCIGEGGFVDGLEHISYASGFELVECTLEASTLSKTL
jgi:hypothetical protein